MWPGATLLSTGAWFAVFSYGIYNKDRLAASNSLNRLVMR
jgi:hypothetical protein